MKITDTERKQQEAKEGRGMDFENGGKITSKTRKWQGVDGGGCF